MFRCNVLRRSVIINFIELNFADLVEGSLHYCSVILNFSIIYFSSTKFRGLSYCSSWSSASVSTYVSVTSVFCSFFFVRRSSKYSFHNFSISLSLPTNSPLLLYNCVFTFYSLIEGSYLLPFMSPVSFMQLNLLSNLSLYFTLFSSLCSLFILLLFAFWFFLACFIFMPSKKWSVSAPCPLKIVGR